MHSKIIWNYLRLC